MRTLLSDRVALALLVAALVIRLLVAAEVALHGLDQSRLAWTDMHAIEQNARRIAAGDVLLLDRFLGAQSHYVELWGEERFARRFGPYTYVDAPLYHYVLGATHALVPSPSAVPFLQALLGTATCALVYLVALRREGRATARVALALAALSLELVGYGAFQLRESLLALLVIWVVHELQRADDEAGLAWARAGLAVGLAWLAKTTAAVLLPVAAVVIARQAWGAAGTARARVRLGLRAAAVFALAAALPVAPFAARNVLLGVPPLENAVSHEALAVAYNLPEYAGGGWKLNADHARGVLARRGDGSTLGALAEAVGEHPTWDSWPRQLGRKLAFFASPVDFWDNVRVTWLAKLWASLRLAPVTWTALAPLAATGLALALRSRAHAAARLPLLGAVALGLGTALVAGVLTRFRVPMIPVCAVLAGTTLAEVARLANARRLVPAAALALAVVAVAIIFDRPVGWLGPRPITPRPNVRDLVDYVSETYPKEQGHEEARRYLAARLLATLR